MKKNITTIHQIEDLEKANDLLHDCWFSVDQISFDKNKSTLLVKFEKKCDEDFQVDKRLLFFEKVRIPVTEWIIKFSHVINWNIQDTENVGSYDFNVIRYSDKEKLISITTGVPLLFHINTSELLFSIENTGKVVSEISSWRLKSK